MSWDDYYSQRKPEARQVATERYIAQTIKPKKTYNEADFAPYSTQWQYKWDDPIMKVIIQNSSVRCETCLHQSVISPV